MADEQRLIRVKSSLGPNKFLMREVHIHEVLGEPFTIELKIDSDDFDIDYKSILGDHLSLELDLTGNEHRYFDGMVTRFAYAGLTDNRATYEVTLRPWLWLLSHHAQCKIFQGKKVPDIIKEVFRAAKFDDFEDKLQRSDYPTLDYCVQYRESDFAFVSRLMEQEGIYYYFKHGSGVHKMVLCDGTTAHGKYDDKYGSIKMARKPDDDDVGSVWDWTLGRELQSGQYTHTDYDLEKPNADLKKSKSMRRATRRIASRSTTIRANIPIPAMARLMPAFAWRSKSPNSNAPWARAGRAGSQPVVSSRWRTASARATIANILWSTARSPLLAWARRPRGS